MKLNFKHLLKLSRFSSIEFCTSQNSVLVNFTVLYLTSSYMTTGTSMEDPPVDQVPRQQDRTQKVSLQTDRPRRQIYLQTVR